MKLRGGILLDLFLIGALLFAGFWLWSRLRGVAWLERLPAPVRRWVSPSPGGTAASRGRSVQLHNGLHDLLSRHGFGDREVLKSLSEERGEITNAFIEHTWELTPPATFRLEVFRRDLARWLKAEGFRVVRMEVNEHRWLWELGEGGRVYQRLVLVGHFLKGRHS